MKIQADAPTDSSPSLTWPGQGIGWLSLAILVIFTWLPYSYHLMVSWPWIALWQWGFLSLLGWTIWLLRQFQLPFRRLGYGLDWAVGAIAIALILSASLAQFQEVALWNLSLAIPYGILLYVLRNWLGWGGLTIARLWLGIPLVGVVTCIVGWVKWYPEFAAGAPRNQWPMGHPNFVAGYLVLILPLTLSLAFSRKGWQRIALLAGAALMAAVLYSTGSRGGFLGILVLALAAIVVFLMEGRGLRRRWRLAACLALLTVVVAVALKNPRVQQIVNISAPADNSQLVNLRIDGQTEDRLWMLQASGNILRDKPLLGVGIGNMSRVYNLYRPLETGVGATNVQQLHNTPAQILGEMGLVGLSAYGAFVGVLAFLWWRLYQKLTQPSERLLLYGIGGGLLAYGASSLTDYQLENISISSTLVMLIALLIGLADRHLNAPNSLNNYSRRLLSLGGIFLGVSLFLLWLPVTWAMQLSSVAVQDFKAGKITIAYEKLSLASNLAPWDPIYALLAGLENLETREKMSDPKIYQELTKLATKHLEAALKASPYDPGFNQNLGMLYREGKSNHPEIYFGRTIQLLPRSDQYTYYLLGQQYLKQEKTEAAITAFALQALNNPDFLTSVVWKRPPLSKLQEPVLAETLNLTSELLKQLPPDSPNYNLIYETQVVWRWWHKKPLANIEQQRLRPIVRAIILAEKSPQSALELLNTELVKSPNSPDLLLLRAWINPQKYLESYLNSGVQLTPEDKHLIQKQTYQYRELRGWLLSLLEKIKFAYRPAFIFPYRNFQATEAAYVSLPTEVETYSFVKLLGLFPPLPRSIPQLEHLIDQVKTEKLNLPQPVNNNFQVGIRIKGLKD